MEPENDQNMTPKLPQKSIDAGQILGSSLGSFSCLWPRGPKMAPRGPSRGSRGPRRAPRESWGRLGGDVNTRFEACCVFSNARFPAVWTASPRGTRGTAFDAVRGTRGTAFDVVRGTRGTASNAVRGRTGSACLRTDAASGYVAKSMLILATYPVAALDVTVRNQNRN